MKETKIVKVRCWKISNIPNSDDLFISYPEGHMGHDLIICLKCGQIHAADVSSQLYIKPFDEQLKQYRCSKCDNILANNSAKYPETFINRDGFVAAYNRPKEIPNDKESIVVEFPSIY